MTATSITTALEYYARHGAALFPIPAGQKNPTGIIQSFAHDYSLVPGQWQAWHAEHNCNFGLVAGPSKMIVLDIDTKEGRDAAWAEYVELCNSWGLQSPPAPHIQTRSGGWHVLFRVPDDVDSATLRQPDAIKKVINVRAGNGYVVTAGSQVEGSPYLFISDAPPHPAPAALIQHCTRSAPSKSAVDRVGTYDKDDTERFLRWMTERDAFDAYEDWLAAGMALKIEFGDAGLDLWRVTHNDTVTDDVEQSKWESFSTEPTPGCVTLMSLTKRGKAMGWTGSIGEPVKSMFSDIVSLMAAQAGAATQATQNQMIAAEAWFSEKATPALQDFLAATDDAPLRPASIDYPTLPDVVQHHGLFSIAKDVIVRVMAIAEAPQRKWNQALVIEPLGILKVIHGETCDAIVRRILAIPRTINKEKISLAAEKWREDIQYAFKNKEQWVRNDKTGNPESDTSDNVNVLLGIVGADLRWNVWKNRMEIFGGGDGPTLTWRDWTMVEDKTIAALMKRAKRHGTNFRPAKDFLRDTMRAIAHENEFDPVVGHMLELQGQWDRQPRLAIWLTATCGVPCDPYHQAVGKNVIGGMVKRARNPGAKHDEVMVLMGPQGTMKSTLCRTLAMRDEWFTDSVSFEGSPQNIIPQLFGRLVVELAELDGMARKEVQSIKRFISSQSDNVTLKYEAYASEHARRCIFIGTSNEHTPLVDVTGNRRFLPVRVERKINLDWLRANLDQLIAEACVLEAAGADFRIPDEVLEVAKQHQEAARSVSDIETILSEWFRETEFTAAAYVTKSDLSVASELAGWKRMESQRSSIMKRLGFREELPRLGGARTQVWVRGPDMLPRHIAELPRFVLDDTRTGFPRFHIRGTGNAAPAPAAPIAPPPLPGPR